MTGSIGFHALAVHGGRWRGCGGVPQRPINRRQGKSAALRRAQLVGWIGVFCHQAPLGCWRLLRFPWRFQRLRRHPPVPARSVRP